MEAWEKFLKVQQAELGEEAVSKWLRSLKIIHFDAGNLYLEAKDAFQAMWFEEHIRPKVRNHLFNNNHHRIKVHLTVAEELTSPKHVKSKKKNAPSALPALDLSPDSLDPFSTLDRFVPSIGNPLPYKLLTELTGYNPEKNSWEDPKLELSAFNPIFIYGGAGTGKTHLLMGLAHAFQKRGLKVFYIHAEKFTAHVVQAIRTGAMQEFRKAYRHVDVLIIDDIHLLARRNATQEELFHTFNTLHTSGKQIILGSNASPSFLTDIEPRLISRFEWGILLGLEKLSLQEHKQVLFHRCTALNFGLEEKVIDYLLDVFSRCPKALHRAFEALVLRSGDLRADKITVKTTEALLEDLIKEEKENELSPEMIIRSVADFYGLRSEDILGKSQTHECALPRQIAMHLCRTQLKIPFIKIGTIFSRDHSTVMTSVKQIQKRLDSSDKELTSSISAILRRFETA